MSELADIRKIAQSGADRVSDHPKVAAILLTGSVPLEDADAASDVDLILYLNEAFTKDEYDAEVAAAKASGGDLHFGDPENGFGVWHFIGGRKVDFGFGQKTQTEEILDALLVSHDPNPTYQLIARGILNGEALEDDGSITGWKQRLSDYPAPLAEATIKACLKFMPAWVMREMGAKRDDPFLVYECALPASSNLCGILAALNRRYHPGKAKRLDRFASELTIAPKDFAKRLRAVFDLQLPEGVNELESLVRETLELVDEHCPNVDTTPCRKRYDMKLAQ